MNDTYSSGHCASSHPGHESSGPSGSSFFKSLRRSGWYRAENRTVGGVCSGIAAKTGWDLALVRGLSIIACLFAPPLLAAYGLAWALLPEQRDGRIHAEELFAGRFDAAQFGAGFLVFLGLTSLTPLSLSFSNGSPFSVFMSFGIFGFLVFVPCIALALFFSSSRRRSSTQSFPHVPPSQSAPSAPGMNTNFTVPESPEATASAPVTAQTSPSAPSFTPQNTQWRTVGGEHTQPIPSSPVWTPPIPVPVARVSRRSNLFFTGLIVLIMAATFLMMHLIERGVFFSGHTFTTVVNAGLIGAGLCLLSVGLALVITAIRGKNAGWFIAMSLIGCFLAIPTMLLGLMAHTYTNTDAFDFIDESPSLYDWTSSTVYGSALGQAHLDLSAAPSDTVKDIYITTSVSDLSISTRADQPVKIICTQEIEDIAVLYWNDSPAPNQKGSASADWISRLRSCADLSEKALPSVSTHSSTWTPEQGITIHLDTQLENFVYSEETPPLHSDTATEPDQKFTPNSPESAESAQSAAVAHDLQPLSSSAHDKNRSL